MLKGKTDLLSQNEMIVKDTGLREDGVYPFFSSAATEAVSHDITLGK